MGSASRSRGSGSRSFFFFLRDMFRRTFRVCLVARGHGGRGAHAGHGGHGGARRRLLQSQRASQPRRSNSSQHVSTARAICALGPMRSSVVVGRQASFRILQAPLHVSPLRNLVMWRPTRLMLNSGPTLSAVPNTMNYLCAQFWQFQFTRRFVPITGTKLLSNGRSNNLLAN